METVTKFRADDGAEFHRLTDAEAHDFFLQVRRELKRGNGWDSYPVGYDGPMPSYEPKLMELCYKRQQVRHLFLDVEPPAPEVVREVEVRVERRFPHWAAWWALIIFGFVLGRMAASFL